MDATILVDNENKEWRDMRRRFGGGFAGIEALEEKKQLEELLKAGISSEGVIMCDQGMR